MARVLAYTTLSMVPALIFYLIAERQIVSGLTAEQYVGCLRRLVLLMGLIHIIAGMIGAGVFDRYPSLRVSFGESGAGWLAYALHRMDFEFEDRFRDLMKLKPSEYWRRQCKATFQFDPISAKLIDEIGVETMMWG